MDSEYEIILDHFTDCLDFFFTSVADSEHFRSYILFSLWFSETHIYIWKIVLNYLFVCYCSYLLVLDRTNWKTNILTSLLIPYIFLSLPSVIFSIFRWLVIHFNLHHQIFSCYYIISNPLDLLILPFSGLSHTQGRGWQMDRLHRCCT